MRPPSEANAFFHRFGEKFLDDYGKSKIRCRFCGREYAYNLTKLKQHLCNPGCHSCPKIYEQLKSHADAIYGLETAVRKRKATPASLFKAVDKANNVLAIIVKNDNNPFGIPLGGVNDADPLTDEDPLADEDTDGMVPVYVENKIPTCPVPMAAGTRGEQIAALDGPFVGAEIGESSKGLINTLHKVDVSSPLNPSQENAEKDPIILDPVKIKAKFAAVEQENADLKAKFATLEQDCKAKFAALEQENVDFKAKLAAVEWQYANINKLDSENAEHNVPNLEIPDFNIHDWENQDFAHP